MAKKKNTASDFTEGWISAVSRTLKKERKKAERLEPNQNSMRYYTDYTNSLADTASRMKLIWELFDADQLPQEYAQKILGRHVKEMASQLNELIGYMRVDRHQFHTYNFDKVENYQGILSMYQLKRGLDNEEGYLYFSAAIKEKDIYQDETHIALLIEERIPESIEFSSIQWEIDYVLEDHVILKVWLDDFSIEEELLERIKKY